MKRRRLAIDIHSCTAAALSALFLGCAPPPEQAGERSHYDASGLDGNSALEEVRAFLKIGPRHSGTAGAERAAEYLAARLRGQGLKVELDRFTDRSGETNMVFRNVLGTIAGKSAKTIVLASHYDTKAGISANFIGANDSGSSTGLLLALAGFLAKAPTHPCTILFAFFDGEECVSRYGPTDGLHGSRRLARDMSAGAVPVAVIVLDMVGDSDLTVTIPRNSSPELIAMAFEAAHEVGVRDRFSLARTDILDDHVPFRQAGIPAIDIIDFQFGSEPGRNDYWHTDEDTIDKLSAESLESVGRVTIGIINRLIQEHGAPTRP